MSPLMIIMISFSSPAGVTLYWVVGGIFSCIQSLITTLYHKPKVKAELAEHFDKNPIKAVKPTVKDVTPKTATTPLNNKKNTNGRNAGKQQRK